jgi:hypothetical protein
LGLRRLISLTLLVPGLYFLGRDAATMLAGSGLGPEAIETLWRRLDGAGLNAVQTFIERHLPGGVWDPGIVFFLRLPVWTFPLVLGGLLLFSDLFPRRSGDEATQ